MRAAPRRLRSSRARQYARLGDMDPLTKGIIAWHTELSYMLPLRTIYMDGRPHPRRMPPTRGKDFRRANGTATS